VGRIIPYPLLWRCIISKRYIQRSDDSIRNHVIHNSRVMLRIAHRNLAKRKVEALMPILKPTPKPDIPSVTQEECQKFMKDYLDGKYPYERLGQAFMNHCLEPKSWQDQELWNATDRKKAIDLIYARYISLK